MPYAISGLLGQMEEAKRRMQQPLAPPPDAFQLPQQGGPPAPPAMSPPLAPPPNAFANIANANISDTADLTHGHRRGIKGLLPHLLGTDRVAPEVAALLTPDQVERVKPGVVGSLWNAINYGKGPQAVMQDKAMNMLALTDKKTARDKSSALAQLQAAWTPTIFAARTPEEMFEAQRGYANARAAILGTEEMGTTPNFLAAMKPDAPKEFAPRPITYRENVLGEGDKPFIVGFDESGKEVSRVPQWVRPEKPDDLTAYQRASLSLRERAAGIQKEAGGVQLPNVAIEKLIALDDAIAAGDAAVSAMADAKKAGADVSGRVGGLVPVPIWLRNVAKQGGELGRSARSKMGNLTSMIGNLRSGGAITPQEFERLETFLPTKDDDEAVVDGKLRDFTAFLKQMRASRIAAYQKYGKGAGGGSVPEPNNPNESDADMWERLRSEGMSAAEATEAVTARKK